MPLVGQPCLVMNPAFKQSSYGNYELGRYSWEPNPGQELNFPAIPYSTASIQSVVSYPNMVQAEILPERLLIKASTHCLLIQKAVLSKSKDQL